MMKKFLVSVVLFAALVAFATPVMAFIPSIPSEPVMPCDPSGAGLVVYICRRCDAVCQSTTYGNYLCSECAAQEANQHNH